MTLEPGFPAAPTSLPQVCLAAGAEVGSRARAEVSQKRSQAGRRASSEPAPRPPRLSGGRLHGCSSPQSVQNGKKKQVFVGPPTNTHLCICVFCDPLYVKFFVFWVFLASTAIPGSVNLVFWVL